MSLNVSAVAGFVALCIAWGPRAPGEAARPGSDAPPSAHSPAPVASPPALPPASANDGGEPPVTPTAPAIPAGPAEGDRDERSAVERLPGGTRAAVGRRARFVYELPDGVILDSYWYVEFRSVLAEHDSASPPRPYPARARAWGFAPGQRFPSASERPAPLWHTVTPIEPVMFKHPIYVNTGLLSPWEKRHGPMAVIEKKLADDFYRVSVKEYPGGEAMRLPASFPLGFASLTVHLPPALRLDPKEGKALTGEFFLLPDESIERPAAVAALGAGPAFRFVHAAELRLTPERYARALLEGKAELVEWSFRRVPGRGEGVFVWTRRVAEVGEGESAERQTPSDTEEGAR